MLLQHSLCDRVCCGDHCGRYGRLLGLSSVWSRRHYHGGEPLPAVSSTALYSTAVVSSVFAAAVS